MQKWKKALPTLRDILGVVLEDYDDAKQGPLIVEEWRCWKATADFEADLKIVRGAPKKEIADPRRYVKRRAQHPKLKSCEEEGSLQ